MQGVLPPLPVTVFTRFLRNKGFFAEKIWSDVGPSAEDKTVQPVDGLFTLRCQSNRLSACQPDVQSNENPGHKTAARCRADTDHWPVYGFAHWTSLSIQPCRPGFRSSRSLLNSVRVEVSPANCSTFTHRFHSRAMDQSGSSIRQSGSRK